MRSSLITMASLASVAVASPLLKNMKKAIIWDYVTDIVYVTVTDNGAPKTTVPAPAPVTTVTVKHTNFAEAPVTKTKTRSKASKSKIVVVPTTTSTTPPPPPPPAPTTSAAPPPPPPAPITTTAPAPAPEPTTEAPAPAPTTEAPAPAPTTFKSVVAAAVPSPSPIVAAQESVAKPVVAASDALPSDFASTGVYYHNMHRANHSAPAVTWDADLAKSAQVLADTCTFHHDLTIGGGGYGQNIDSVGMAGSGTETSVPAWDKSAVLANSITNNWYYAEVGAYANDYSVATPIEGAVQLYHFTQIVWKKSTTIGCAVAYCGQDILPGNYGWYSVCNYGPAGNFLGDFPKQVTKPMGHAALKVPTPWA